MYKSKRYLKGFMKHSIKFGTILLVVLAFCLPKLLFAAEPLKFATDKRGDFSWIMGTKIAKTLNDSGIPTDVIISGGCAENLDLLLNSKADIALVSTPALNRYLNEGGEIDKFSTITALWPRAIHFLLLDKFIKTGTLNDFHRRRVYLGPKGSLKGKIVEEVFESMGIKTKRTVMTLNELNIVGIMTNYIEQKLDGAIFIDRIPSPNVESILAKTGHFYKLIPAGREASGHLNGLGKGFFIVEVPEDIYTYQHEKYITIGIGSFLIARKDLPDETARKLVEAIFDNVDAIEKDFNFGFGLKKESGANNLVVPLHPGVDEYFKTTP
jgi:uncharacterized protein